MLRLMRAYLLLLAVLTLLSCVGLLVIPAQLGAITPWGPASGWQREIAFWNFSMYILIVRTLRRDDAVAAQLLATALVVLNVLVAANHFVAVAQSSGALLNSIAGALNAGAGILGLLALWQARIAASAPTPA
jgi:hypothetical protein